MREKHPDLEQQLRRALATNELVLHYQPQAALATGRVAALEALVRWNSPDAGLLYPDEFLPLAEQSDLIHEIGTWVAQAACSQLKTWRDQYGIMVPVAINFAMNQVSEKYVNRLEALLEQYEIAPKYLELELTEDATMQDPDASIALMRRLKKIGVSLAIDDFGLGYSNLAYLKRFPVDKLKIDMQFTQGLIDSVEDRSVTAAIIRLANNLGLRTVAESVEREGQLRFLLDEDCDAMQGYYFSRPLPSEAVPEFLLSNSRLDLSALRRRPYCRRLLLISEDSEACSGFRSLADSEGFELLEACNATEALNTLACSDVSVVVSDVTESGRGDMSILESIRQLYPSVVRVLATDNANPVCLSEAINYAQPYKHIDKPWNPNRAAELLQDAFRYHEGGLLPRGYSYSAMARKASDIERWRLELTQTRG